MNELVQSFSKSEVINSPVELPRDQDIDAAVDWNHESLENAVFDCLETGDLNQLCGFFDVLLDGVSRERISNGVFFLLLESVLDLLTVDQVSEFWGFMESRRDRITPNLVGSKPPGTTLLRALNSLMRRLDPSVHKSLRYRISIYLAETFGMLERTALNTQGKFAESTIEIVENGEDSSRDFSLFCQVQQQLSNPAEVIASNKEVATFLQLAKDLARVFEGARLRDYPVASTMLLSPELWPYQLSSRRFQRTACLEILLFIEFLRALSPEDRKATDGLKLKAIVPPLVLSEENFRETGNLKRTWFFLLKDASTREQLDNIKALILSEKRFINWKLSGFPSFVRERDLFEPTGKFEYSERARYWDKMGNAKLSQLWQVEIGLTKYEQLPQPLTDPIVVFGDSNSANGEGNEDLAFLALRTLREDKWRAFNLVPADHDLGKLFEAVQERDQMEEIEPTPTPAPPEENEERNDGDDDYSPSDLA